MGLQCGTITILDRKSGSLSASEAVGLPRQLSKEEYLRHYRPLIDDVIRTGQAWWCGYFGGTIAQTGKCGGSRGKDGAHLRAGEIRRGSRGLF